MHSSQLIRRSFGGDSDDVDVSLFRRGQGVLDATFERTVVASLEGLLFVPGLDSCECCRLMDGGVIVAAVSGDRFLEEAAILTCDRRQTNVDSLLRCSHTYVHSIVLHKIEMLSNTRVVVVLQGSPKVLSTSTLHTRITPALNRPNHDDATSE